MKETSVVTMPVEPQAASQETERAGTQSQQQQQQQQQQLHAFVTTTEVVTHVRELIATQLEARVGRVLAPNAEIAGDAKARSEFFTLLPRSTQRQLFLQTANTPSNWPALRGLFGAPPYSFLLPQDVSVMRAAGIAHSRQSMTYQDTHIENYNQFGDGHLVDGHERVYKVVEGNAAAQSHKDAPPVWYIPAATDASYSNILLQLVVRLRKRSPRERMRRLRDTNLKKSTIFPVSGERLLLKHTKRILKFTGTHFDGADTIVLRVHRVMPRAANATTAAILASVIQ